MDERIKRWKYKRSNSEATGCQRQIGRKFADSDSHPSSINWSVFLSAEVSIHYLPNIKSFKLNDQSWFKQQEKGSFLVWKLRYDLQRNQKDAGIGDSLPVVRLSKFVSFICIDWQLTLKIRSVLMKTDVEPESESKPVGKKKPPGIQSLINALLSFTWTDIKIICSLLLVAHVDRNTFSQTPSFGESSQLDCLTSLIFNFEREIHRHRIHYDCPFNSQQNFGLIIQIHTIFFYGFLASTFSTTGK